MRPEFPLDRKPGGERVTSDDKDGWPCEMRRGDYMCGNRTSVYLLASRQVGSGYTVLPICDLCEEELGMTGAQTTAYWRKKQRKWGVR